MLSPQLCLHADDVRAAILEQRAGDNLQSDTSRFVRVRDHRLLHLGSLDQLPRHRHLERAAAGHQPWVHVDSADTVHRVAEVALDLVEHVLGGAAQYDAARLGALAVDDPREVLVTNLLHLEEARARANVLLADLCCAVHDCRAGRAGDAVVIRLANSAQHGDVGFLEVVLREIGNAFLCDDQVGGDSDDVVAHLLDDLLLLLQQLLPRLLVGELNARLALALFVFERAIQ
mmetsp:Transcript_26368/g.59779  ORF Transcript_26368/g.59779 Transcript_26368/m.59779 type:complete len:231 (-) Transcript_26368:764-1456(-)